MSLKQTESAFRELFERNHARWTGISRAYAADGEREDLLQEIMMQVWRSLPRFEGRSSVDTWAYRVALNAALAWDRASRRRVSNVKTNSTALSCLAGKLESNTFEMRILDEFLATLSKTDRLVMLLSLDNVPNHEAAEIMGITEGTLRVRAHRIRKQFEETYCNQGTK
jgi:RNA polymerase sigma-70 factor (ECF subfamily)